MLEILVEHLIPQREPFVLVDGILSHGNDETQSTFTIPADHILIEEGHLSSYGMLEHMAQTAALRSGYEAMTDGQRPKTGFIGTIDKSEIHRLPSIGMTIHTRIRQTASIMNFIVVECNSFAGDQLLATSTMKIVLQDEF
ncbi:MAG: hypothetical protein J5I59_01290 [Saprospiraceae bacterium]|nr:hypothetical protein [Saprospiraceae bacterium]